MSKEFDYSILTDDQRKSIHDALAETTVKHINRSGDLFGPMEFDPVNRPSQRLETTHLNPKPVTLDILDYLAKTASPDLHETTKAFLSRQKTFLSAARLLLGHQDNIFAVTNHGNIKDVAIWEANWDIAMNGQHWQEQNGLIISRGVTTIQAFGMAGSEVMQNAGHVFMSFPRTKTIDQLGFDDELINANNRAMRSEIKTWLGQDLIHRFNKRRLGKVLHVAWSGKTDEIRYGDDGAPEHITMGKVSQGIIDIIKRGFVLPVTIWDGEDPFVEIGELTKVQSEKDVQRVQKWQGDTLARVLGIKRENINVG